MLEKTSELVSAFVEATGLPASRVTNISRVLIASGWLPGARAARVPPLEPSDHPLGPAHVAALMLAMAAERVLDAERVLVYLSGLHTGAGDDYAAMPLLTEVLIDGELPDEVSDVSIMPPYMVILGPVSCNVGSNGRPAGEHMPARAVHSLQYPAAVVKKLRAIALDTIGYHEAEALLESEGAQAAGSIQ